MYKKLIYLCLTILTIIYVLSLINRKIDIDDSMLGEHAYWMAKEGRVKTLLFWGNGIGWSQEQFHYHKLFVAIGALFIKLFGFSLTSLKSVSLVFFLLFIYVLYKYLKKYYSNYFEILALSILILIANAEFFNRSFMFRPEIMVMLFGFLSYAFLDVAITEKNSKYISFSGIMAGLATLSHLNGLIFAFAAIVFLISKKKFRAIFLFGIPFTITSLFYFFNINSIAEFQTFWNQFNNDPNLIKDDFSILEPFIKLLKEHARFFHSPKEAAFSIIFIVSCIFGYRYYSKQEKTLFLYLILLIIGLGGLAHSTTSKYAVIYFPFIIILISSTVFHLKANQYKKFIALQILIVCYIAVEMIYNIALINDRLDVAERNKYIGEQMLQGSNVYGNEYFLFNGIENFTVKSPLPLEYEKGFKSMPMPYQEKKVFELAEKGNNKYIVLDTIYDNAFYNGMIRFLNPRLGKIYYNYKLVHIKKGIYIFQHV